MSETTKSNVPAAPTRAQFKDINDVKSLKELFEHPGFRKRIADAAGKHLDPERLLRMFQYSVQKQPKLAKVNPMSMMGIFISLSWLNLEPNTPLGLAHVLPFDVNKWNPQTRQREYLRTDANMIIGYQGYLDLIQRTDKVQDLECDVVWPGDEFDYERGSRKHLHHKPRNRARDTKEEPEYAYMFARLANGGEVFEVLTKADVHHHRARSQAFRSAMFAHDDAVKAGKDPLRDARYADTPWIRDPIPMWRKTALRAGQVWVPKTVELAAAFAFDATADRGEVDFSKVIDGSVITDGGYDLLTEEHTLDAGAAFGTREGEKEPITTDVQQTGQDKPGTATTGHATTTQGKPADPAQTQTKPRATRTAAPTVEKSPPATQSKPAPAAVTTTDEPPANRWGDDGGHPATTQTATASTSTGGGVHFTPTADDQPTQDRTQPTQEEGPGEFYLADANGEPVADGAGYTNAVWAARAFMHLWDKADADGRTALLEFNADALDEIKQTPKAADILLAMMDDGSQGETSAEAPGKWFVPLPTTPNGKVHLPNYIAAVRKFLADNVRTEADMDTWVAANEASWGDLPPATRTAVSKAVTAHRQTMAGGGDAGEHVRDKPAATQQQQATDKDRELADRMLAEVAGITTLNALNAMRDRVDVKVPLARWERERTELHGEVASAAQAKYRELRGGA